MGAGTKWKITEGKKEERKDRKKEGGRGSTVDLMNAWYASFSSSAKTSLEASLNKRSPSAGSIVLGLAACVSKMRLLQLPK
jgi:hypothetical protein